MAIIVQCGCGKRLKVRDELAGRRVRCPACDRAVVVPAASAMAQPEAESPPRLSLCPSCGKPIAPGAVVCTNCGLNIKSGKRLTVQTQDSPPLRGAAGRASPAGALTSLAERLPPLGLTIKLLLLLALVAGAGWWIYGFTHPAPVHSSNFEIVDAYAVIDGLEPTTVFRHVESLGEAFGDFSLGGRHMLVVTHPAPSSGAGGSSSGGSGGGKFLHVQFNLSRRYLANHGKLTRDKFYLSAADIQLIGGDGEVVSGLFLTGRQRGESARINLRRLPENATLPFTGESLDPWRTPGAPASPGHTQGTIEPRYRLDGVLQSIEGEWEFRAENGDGLHIRMAGDGPVLIVSWGPRSTGWRAAPDIDEPATAFETFGHWPVNLLFPRPATTPYKLKVGDDMVPLGHD